jgi:hypothetical protein
VDEARKEKICEGVKIFFQDARLKVEENDNERFKDEAQ